METPETPPVNHLPHPYDIVKDEARKLLLSLNGRQTRPEANVLIEWLGSRRWYMVNSAETAKQTWHEISLQGDGSVVQSAVDIIIDLTIRTISQLKYYGIFNASVTAFVEGQTALKQTTAIHDNLRDKLPGVRHDLRAAAVSGVNKSPDSGFGFNRGTNNNAVSYEDLIIREPWIMVCQWLLASGLLHELTSISESGAHKSSGRAK